MALAAALLIAAVPAAWRDAGDAAGPPIVFRFDANAATAADWATLPGVGPVLATRLAGGRYDRPEDLLAVKGIGPKTLARLRPWLRFPSDPPPGEAAAGRETDTSDRPRADGA